MGHKNNLIFQLTVTPTNVGERDKEYKIFDGEPSFFDLSQKDRKDFLNQEIAKVKEFLDREYMHSKALRA